MKKVLLLLSVGVVAGCGVQPVKMATPDGSQRYFMDCGDDKGQCITKANELCPNGYSMSNESDTNQVSFNAWRGGSSRQVTVEVQCK
ncbi:hypothetical protein K6981_11150 [Xanthomonas cucurbitae]|uniref:hypothetical protein n=1 Tax=Xanthomonas cucurbitae TaxID=56453 RepID=UPI002368D44F|nr:hypothetical protein [Xanthomonas cucurbitae]WDM66141.1 hypothetical protein K6981_11150 [Xanthomonas cucurbitae]